MIIKPAVRTEFTTVPNTLLRDEALNADTRCMVMLVLSRPPSWQVRPKPLAKALSRKGDRPLGQYRLGRMFREAMAAGYMARSAQQTHQEDGSFGPYVYFMGMPEDVAKAVVESGVAILAQCGNPCTDNPCTGEPCTGDSAAIHKRKTPLKTESRNSLSKSFPQTSPQQADEQEHLTAYGKEQRSCDKRFVFEESEPFRSWVNYKGLDGLPPTDVIVRNGERRLGIWMDTLWPPKKASAA
jgi:hypothetical protein